MIPLNPPVRPLDVRLDGDDEAVRAAASAEVAALLDDPPALLLTSSCSSSLDAVAAMLDLAPGDEVVVSAFTFPTSAAPFTARGATIRFADADPRTASASVESIEAVLTERTRAVVLTHYAGFGVDLAPLADRLDAGGVDVVEDAAHGLHARLHGRALGRLGRFGCLSFHRTKNLSAIEGGALVVNDPADVDAALVAVDKGTNRVRFEQGKVHSYEWMGRGSAWRMPEGAVRYLAAELGRVDEVQARRQQVRSRYETELAGWAADHGVGLVTAGEGQAGPAHLFALVLAGEGERDAFVAHCAAAGVQAARHYRPLPSSAFGASIRHPDDACPVAEALGAGLVRIPLHDALSDDDVDRVVDAVRRFSPRR